MASGADSLLILTTSITTPNNALSTINAFFANVQANITMASNTVLTVANVACNQN